MSPLKKSVVKISIILTVSSVFFVQRTEALKCFQCNSLDNSDCVGLTVYRGIQSIEPTDCDGEYGGNMPFCRKTLIQVLDKIKQKETRVIRSCGWVKHKNPCYTADNEGHNEKVCQCFTDFCNAAPRASVLAASALLPLLLLAMTR